MHPKTSIRTEYDPHARAVWDGFNLLGYKVAQGIEAGTGETERLDAKRESPVAESHAPKGGKS